MDEVCDCGYDNDFVDDLPDSLKCAICCFALRNPIQLATCGHRFCKICFEGIKERALKDHIDVLCPIDRILVDGNKVFEDKAADRQVMDLQVKCPHRKDGCVWEGEMRFLEEHRQQKCPFEEKKNIIQMLKTLQKRIEGCEKQLLEKDKYIGEIKNEFAVEREKCNSNLKILEGQFYHCQKELKTVKDELEVLKSLREEDSHSKKRKLDKGDLGALEDALNTNDLSSKWSYLSNLHPIRNDLDDMMEKDCSTGEASFSHDSGTMCGGGEESSSTGSENTRSSSGSNALSFSQQEVSSSSKNIKTPKEHIQPVEPFKISLPLEEEFSKMLNEISLFQQKKSIVDQVLSNEVILFKWHLKDYNLVRRSKSVASPFFYAGLHGHCCRLFVMWSGDEMSILGIHFQIITANKQNRNPFNMSIELEIQGKNGLKKQFFIRSAFIRDHQAEFELPSSGGRKEFIKMPELQNFVINDSVFVTCKLYPSIL